MASIYLRLPHYVAAYFRNRDEANPIKLGGQITFGRSEPFFYLLKKGVFCNSHELVSRKGCFCERQWRRMMRGDAIYTIDGEDAPRHGVLKPSHMDTLNDSEVALLTGVTCRTGDDAHEYLRITLPSEVYMKEKMVRPTAQWQLTNAATSQLINELTAEFWRAFFSYIDRDNTYCSLHGIDRSITERIERFMLKFDIRCSADYHERKNLKRYYFRKRASNAYNESDFIEHGSCYPHMAVNCS